MAVAFATDICRGALQDLGRLGSGQAMNADDGALALERLNALIGQYGADNLTIYFSTRTVKAITASTGSYTIGTGGDVNIVRPVYLDDVRLINTSTSPSLETPLNWLTDAAYRQVAQKGLTNSLPTSWWYNPTFTTARGTLELLPVPTGTTLQFVVYSPTALTEYAALTTAFSLPPGYERMLRTNLAVELAVPFEKEPTAWLLHAAQDSMATVKRANLQRDLAELSVDPGALIQSGSGRYDIYSDRNL